MANKSQRKGAPGRLKLPDDFIGTVKALLKAQPSPKKPRRKKAKP